MLTFVWEMFLLICGAYGVSGLIKEFKKRKVMNKDEVSHIESYIEECVKKSLEKAGFYED